MDEDDNGIFRPERVKRLRLFNLPSADLDHIVIMGGGGDSAQIVNRLDEAQGEGGHPHQAESTFHEQKPGLPAATHLWSDHSTIPRVKKIS